MFTADRKQMTIHVFDQAAELLLQVPIEKPIEGVLEAQSNVLLRAAAKTSVLDYTEITGEEIDPRDPHDNAAFLAGIEQYKLLAARDEQPDEELSRVLMEGVLRNFLREVGETFEPMARTGHDGQIKVPTSLTAPVECRWVPDTDYVPPADGLHRTKGLGVTPRGDREVTRAKKRTAT